VVDGQRRRTRTRAGLCRARWRSPPTAAIVFVKVTPEPLEGATVFLRSNLSPKSGCSEFVTLHGFVNSPSAALPFILALLNSRGARRRSRFNMSCLKILAPCPACGERASYCAVYLGDFLRNHQPLTRVDSAGMILGHVPDARMLACRRNVNEKRCISTTSS
jgi:hypothetical protein